jgi:hypothetical protein
MRKISTSTRIYIVLVLVLVVLGFTMPSCSTSSTKVDTGNLHVLVVSTDNTPLAGSKVVSNNQPEGQLKVTGITGDGGKVIFSDIKAGHYEFYVSRFDYIQQDFALTLESGYTKEITITLVHE